MLDVVWHGVPDVIKKKIMRFSLSFPRNGCAPSFFHKSLKTPFRGVLSLKFNERKIKSVCLKKNSFVLGQNSIGILGTG